MRKLTQLDSRAALEEVAPRGVSTWSDTPIVILRRGYAGNDITCEDPSISNDDAEPWAQHALAANGFGDVATTDTDSSARPTIYELHQAARHRQRRQARDLYGALHQLDDRTLREFARAHRSFSLGEIIVAVIQAAGAIARRAHARHRQRRQAMATYDALRQLDDRMLRDLGFDRSEIRSVAAEVTGEAEYTRVRALLTSHSLPSARRA